MAGKVAIVVGSKSDLLKVEQAGSVLGQFDIKFVTRILSAHRTPEELADFAKTVEIYGYDVIIAAAGMAAALPGAIKAHTTLPVIGVPLTSDASPLNGVDALLAMLQMPSDVPVAVVSINGAKNAGLLAAEILARKYPEIRSKYVVYREKTKQAVIDSDSLANVFA